MQYIFFPTILMMILEKYYYYALVKDKNYNDEKSVRKCVSSILITYILYRKKRQSVINCSRVWIRARTDIDLPWLVLLVQYWCAKSASEHFLTISHLFSFGARAQTRAHIHIHAYRYGVTRTNECEHLFHFIWKRERHRIKNRFIFFFSSSFSCYRHVQNGQIIITIQLNFSL